MDLQEEDRAADDSQVAWEEEGDRGEENLARGCKDPGGLARPFLPTPYQPHPCSGA